MNLSLEIWVIINWISSLCPSNFNSFLLFLLSISPFPSHSLTHSLYFSLSFSLSLFFFLSLCFYLAVCWDGWSWEEETAVGIFSFSGCCFQISSTYLPSSLFPIIIYSFLCFYCILPPSLLSLSLSFAHSLSISLSLSFSLSISLSLSLYLSLILFRTLSLFLLLSLSLSLLFTLTIIILNF